MDQARQGEIARLKAQGITENSDAWGRSMDTLNRNDVDARNQALLYGAQENNNIFNRGLQQNNQVFGQNQDAQQLALALRGQQANEAYQGNQMNISQRQQLINEQNNPYQQMMWMNSMAQGNPQFGSTGTGVNYSNAGAQDYLSQLGNYNAKTANNQGMIEGLSKFFGNQGGSTGSTGGWGNIAGMLGDAWKYFNG